STRATLARSNRCSSARFLATGPSRRFCDTVPLTLSTFSEARPPVSSEPANSPTVLRDRATRHFRFPGLGTEFAFYLREGICEIHAGLLYQISRFRLQDGISLSC